MAAAAVVKDAAYWDGVAQRQAAKASAARPTPGLVTKLPAGSVPYPEGVAGIFAGVVGGGDAMKAAGNVNGVKAGTSQPAGTTPSAPVAAAGARGLKLPTSIDIHIGRGGGSVEIPGASLLWGERAIWKQHPVLITVAAVVVVAVVVALTMRRRRGR